MSFSPKHQLFWVIAIGFIVRLVFILTSYHLYHPDEVFQTLEPAFKLVNGYGITTWDYEYGLRSFVVPGIFVPFFWLAKTLNLNRPEFYLSFIRLFLITFSLVLIPATYQLVRLLKHSHQHALTAALLVAVWYELAYFGGRPLTEVLALNFLAAAFLAYFHPKGHFAAGFLWLTGFLIRPQFFILSGAAAMWFYFHQKSRLKPIIAGAAIALLIFGLVDRFTYGQFLSHIFNNIRYSYLSGASALYGVGPWYVYIFGLLATNLLFFPLFVLAKKESPHLWVIGTGLLLLHTLIPHKEYRFIYALIPILLILGSLRLIRFLKTRTSTNLACRYVVGAGALLSILGLFNRLPYQGLVYYQSLFSRDPNLLAYTRLASVSTCGIYDETRGWFRTGGYTYLGQNLPFYAQQYPPPNNQGLIHLTHRPDSTGQLINQFPAQSYFTPSGKTNLPGIKVYLVSGICQPRSGYTYNRVDPQIAGKLKSL